MHRSLAQPSHTWTGRRAQLIAKLYEYAGVKKKPFASQGGAFGDSIASVVVLAKKLRFSSFMDACIGAWMEQSALDQVRYARRGVLIAQRLP